MRRYEGLLPASRFFCPPSQPTPWRESFWVSARLGIGGEDHYQRMHPALKRNYRGFEDHDVPFEPFMAALAKDKKNVGKGTVTLILPDRNAQVFKDVYAVDEGFRNLCATYLGEVRVA